jgi:hypothetical protein
VTRMLEPAPEPVMDPHCLWCDRAFTTRMTGGSAQRFCCTGHRQQFWIAARGWTMRAIEVGLLSVDCLKAAHASVHAAGGAFGQGRDATLDQQRDARAQGGKMADEAQRSVAPSYNGSQATISRATHEHRDSQRW